MTHGRLSTWWRFLVLTALRERPMSIREFAGLTGNRFLMIKRVVDSLLKDGSVIQRSVGMTSVYLPAGGDVTRPEPLPPFLPSHADVAVLCAVWKGRATLKTLAKRSKLTVDMVERSVERLMVLGVAAECRRTEIAPQFFKRNPLATVEVLGCIVSTGVSLPEGPDSELLAAAPSHGLRASDAWRLGGRQVDIAPALTRLHAAGYMVKRRPANAEEDHYFAVPLRQRHSGSLTHFLHVSGMSGKTLRPIGPSDEVIQLPYPEMFDQQKGDALEEHLRDEFRKTEPATEERIEASPPAVAPEASHPFYALPASRTWIAADPAGGPPGSAHLASIQRGLSLDEARVAASLLEGNVTCASLYRSTRLQYTLLRNAVESLAARNDNIGDLARIVRGRMRLHHSARARDVEPPAIHSPSTPAALPGKLQKLVTTEVTAECPAEVPTEVEYLTTKLHFLRALAEELEYPKNRIPLEIADDLVRLTRAGANRASLSLVDSKRGAIA